MIMLKIIPQTEYAQNSTAFIEMLSPSLRRATIKERDRISIGESEI